MGETAARIRSPLASQTTLLEGLHIEQPLPARRECGEAVAAAVGAVLAAGEPAARG
jgi:hypothetical protein